MTERTSGVSPVIFIVIVTLNVMKKYLPTCYYNDQSVEENYGAPTIQMAKMKAEIFN